MVQKNYPEKKLVHGIYCSSLAEELRTEIEYAKGSIFPETALYQALGMLKLARSLNIISTEEYLELDRQCIREGLNNPKVLRRGRE